MLKSVSSDPFKMSKLQHTTYSIQYTILSILPSQYNMVTILKCVPFGSEKKEGKNKIIILQKKSAEFSFDNWEKFFICFDLSLSFQYLSFYYFLNNLLIDNFISYIFQDGENKFYPCRKNGCHKRLIQMNMDFQM